MERYLTLWHTNLFRDLFGTDIFLGIRVLTADSEKKMRKAINFALSLDEPIIIMQ